MDGPSPGWYPDPWATGHHRYWDGTAWTGDAFPTAPVNPFDPDMTPELPRVMPPPPQWTPTPTAVMTEIPPPPAYPPPRPPDEPGRSGRPGPFSTGAGFIVLLVVMMLVVGSLAVVGAYYAFGDGSKAKPRPGAAQPAPRAPRPSFPGGNPFVPATPASPADPSGSVLAGLVVRQADVAPTAVVQTDLGGVGLVAPTLDLCTASYPSESRRTARLQVSAFDDKGVSFLGTEAVLYTDPAATAQAFSEMKALDNACPSGSQTKLNAAPDAAWPAVATVDRMAFDVTETDATGTAHHIVAVYLRRGRALIGVYFNQPDGAQPAVAGQSTLPGITNVFANRLAQLPASVTG